LTTDQSVYQVGEPIKFTYTETNTSNQPVDIWVAPSLDGFDVTEAGVPVWKSNAGPNPLFVLLVKLQPGQSHTFSSTWDGVPNQENPPVLTPGSFTVTNQQAPNGPSATFQILPSSGVVVVPPINPVEPAISATLATDHSSYKLGHRVLISLTLTNSGDQPAALGTASGSAGFKIYRGSVLVGQESPKAAAARRRTAVRAQQLLAVGQSKTIHLTWLARPSLHGAKELTPGVYTILAWEGSYSASATINLDG